MYGATIGKASILGVAAATNQACAVGIPLCVSSQFLHYYLVSQADALAAAGQGGAQPNISQGVVRSWPIGLPPLREQDRIVDALDEALSGNDAAAAELLAAKRKLGQLRQSLLKAAVEGTLTVDWRDQEEISSSGSPGVPRDWRLLAINEIGTVQLGRQRSPDKVGGSNPTPYIRAANITERGVDLRDVLEMDFSASEFETFALSQGDVLLTEASGSAEHVGRPAIWPRVDGLFCFQNTVVRFRPKLVSSEFAYFLFMAQQKLGVFASLSAGVGINHLSAGKFGRLRVLVPPLAEQKEIVARLEAAFEAIDEQERTVAWSMARAAAQRQNILRAAFSGQLVPQDPNDEPASVLLERIRAQRNAATDKPAPRRPRKAKITT
jgi:type I restriction enzyme S subunit